MDMRYLNTVNPTYQTDVIASVAVEYTLGATAAENGAHAWPLSPHSATFVV